MQKRELKHMFENIHFEKDNLAMCFKNLTLVASLSSDRYCLLISL
jgi:hypothetical protein